MEIFSKGMIVEEYKGYPETMKRVGNIVQRGDNQ